MKKLFLLAVMALLIARPDVSFAAAYARDYIPLPPGTSLFCAYYNHVSANKLYSDGDKLGDDFNQTANVGLLRYVYYVNAGKALLGDGGFTIDPQFIIPVVDISLSGTYEGMNNGSEFSTTGIGDPIVLATFWFINDPKNKFWVGFTPWLTLPVGQYDRNRLASPGGNRWVIKPEIGIVKGLGEKTYLDLILGGEFYTDNDEYAGSSTLEQDAALQAEAHLSYDITKQWAVSLDYYYSFGGETTVDGVKQDNSQSNHGLGLTLFFLVGSNNQLLVSYRDDFSVKSGAGTNTFGVRWAYFF
ncbi:MAG: transporter [Geobacteraceae bacterium]|nr:transporter [Geobacteraceae bacterium]